MQRKTERKNKMKEFDEMHENIGESEETAEKTKHILTKSDYAEMGLIFAKIAIIVIILVGCWFAIEALIKDFGEKQRYDSQASVSAGVITDKEIINGHAAGGAGIGYYDGKVGYNFNNNKGYVPTVYRIHISAEFEYDGETHQGSNYFDVSEDVYNSYNVGDYFDSKDLTGSSEQQ